MTAPTPDHPLVPADRVSGTDVYSQAGNKLGKVEDVVIEKVSGQVAYAILSHGGVLGMGAKYNPIPWKLLQYDAERRAYVVPLQESDLEQSPKIDETELSGWNDELSREAIYGYYATYGVGPYWG